MPYRILVIEGGALTSRFLQVLESCMADGVFRFATNENEAIELINTYSFDMLLSDLTPSGIDVVPLLQKLSVAMKYPALALFGHVSRRVMIHTNLMARNLGFTAIGTVLKPTDIIDLRDLQQKAEQLSAMVRAQNCAPDGSAGQFDVLPEHDFLLRFQARKSLGTGRIAAVEAVAFGVLCGGPLSARFENDPDEQHLVHLVSKVIAAQHAWYEQGCTVPVWIRLPISILARPGIVDRLHALVVSQQAHAQYIGFELIRSSRKEQLTHYLEVAHHLRLKGFGIAHADFGQGYERCLSSRPAPFTEVRIFPSLVRSAVNNEKLATSLACIVSESRQSGLRVTANGVTTEQELALLQRIFCDEVQGPFIAEAVDYRTFTRVLLRDGEMST